MASCNTTHTCPHLPPHGVGIPLSGATSRKIGLGDRYVRYIFQKFVTEGAMEGEVAYVLGAPPHCRYHRNFSLHLDSVITIRHLRARTSKPDALGLITSRRENARGVLRQHKMPPKRARSLWAHSTLDLRCISSGSNFVTMCSCAARVAAAEGATSVRTRACLVPIQGGIYLFSMIFDASKGACRMHHGRKPLSLLSVLRS